MFCETCEEFGIQGRIFDVRHNAPVLLILMFAGSLIPAMASVTPARQARGISALAVDSQSGAQAGRQTLDPHPFFTEFYLQQFAVEPMPPDSHGQRSWFSPVLSPVTSAASSLSKRVANLRHALVRMMP
jgi:hypothetical protein